MECVRRNKEKEYVEERILRFVSGEMSDDELKTFQLHLMECEYCHTNVMATFKVRDIIREIAAYDELKSAFDKKSWKEVLRLGQVLQDLEYDEILHYIEDRLRAAFAISEFDEDRISAKELVKIRQDISEKIKQRKEQAQAAIDSIESQFKKLGVEHKLKPIKNSKTKEDPESKTKS